jgi:hypothetical protein
MSAAGDEKVTPRHGEGTPSAEHPPRVLHSEDWWQRLLEESAKFDAPYLVESLGDVIAPRILAPLLRREVELATGVVVRSLERPSNTDLAAQALAAGERLVTTIERISERAMTTAGLDEAGVMSLALAGRYAAAIVAAEPMVGPTALMTMVVTALRLEKFDIPLTMRLLDAGQSPEQAMRSGRLIGRYRWWPAWLLKVTTERALAGALDEEFIAALDNCAYASLSSLQAHLARRLLSGDQKLIQDAARRLEGLGEQGVAAKLLAGDLNTVALAARLMSV